MHILHVFDHSIPLHSGYTFRSRAILAQQRALGWRTSHVTSPKHALSLQGRAAGGRAAAPDEVEEVDGLRFYRTPPSRGLAPRLPGLGQYAVMRALEARLEQVVMAEKPDIIQAHSPALNALPACKVGHRHGIPVCYEVRAFWEDAAVSHGTSSDGGVRYRLTRAMETRALAQADAITCICDGLRQDILARGIPPSKVTVIPNAVDVGAFEPASVPDAALRSELGLAGKPVLGFIGSFYEYEGLDLLLEAVPLLQASLPQVQVLLVGGGPAELALRQQADRLGIARQVHFVGRIPHHQVRRYYSLVDVLVYPRRSMRVTELVTPLKPLEAMAQHVIFIASDVGGHRELVRDGETGVLFAKDDVNSLAASVTRTFASRDGWPALRAAGRAFVENERNWANSVARYRPVFEDLVARGRQRAS